MYKNKNLRKAIQLACQNCLHNKLCSGRSTYVTVKNRQTTTFRLSLKKFCCYCKKHQLHLELK